MHHQSSQSISRRAALVGAMALPVAVRLCLLEAIAASNGLAPADVRRQLVMLEKEAAAANLLAAHRGVVPQLSADNVYLEGLPRLVEIVDRGVVGKRDVADKAATLLSQLHTAEAVVPAFFLREAGLRAPAPPFQTVAKEYEQLFDSMSVRPEYAGRVKWYADRLVANEARYQQVTATTAVPWYVIGALHALEASFNFLGHLHNGDAPLDKPTTHVPRGRPNPWDLPRTWERSAEDALALEHFTGATDWTLVRILYRLEGYNGFGYRSKQVHSPYLWSFSNNYLQGKYVEDKTWSATAKSQQCGAAVMIHELARRKVIAR